MKRSAEEFRENLRKHILENINKDARLMDTNLLLNVVDAEAVEKCRVKQFRNLESSVKHFVNRTEDEEQAQKARDPSVRASLLTNHADFRHIALETSLQKVYFDHYGHGSNDSPVPDPPYKGYTCSCGLRYMMSDWRTLPLTCKRCGRITPMGEMKRDGVLNRI